MDDYNTIAHSVRLCCRFNAILCQRSFPHLRAVFDQYKTISKKDIEDAIKSEFSGDIKNSLLTIGTHSHSRHLLFTAKFLQLHYPPCFKFIV